MGFFDPTLRIMADINLVLKVAKQTPPIYVPGSVVTLMGFGGISTRPEAGALAMREAVQVRRIHGLGTFTNLEFVLRLMQHQIKYLIAKYLGSEATKIMISLLHWLKKIVFTKRKSHLDQ